MDVLNDYYFDRVYDDLSREHLKLLQNLKANTGDEKQTQKQVALISTLLMHILKLRNFRKALAEKRD
jgi:hypothetical protein